MSGSRENIASFHLECWHPLTEAPVRAQIETVQEAKPAARETSASGTDAKHNPHPYLIGVSPDLTKLLYDTLVYLYGGVRVRIKRLNMSARAFENAKIEGCEKGFIIESSAGATTYLIPQAKTFEAFHFACPYKRDVSFEHSYHVGWGQHLLQQDPANKAVHIELKVGQSNCTSDIVTVAHHGTRRAYEVTLSTTNLLSNAAKYVHTDFVQIVFLCRDYQLREAVKACCREGGLDANVLARLEFIRCGQALRLREGLRNVEGVGSPPTPPLSQGAMLMRNPERTIAEIHLLSTHFGEVGLDENDPSVVLICHFLLPEGYNRTECEVVIDLGPKYPELPPQDFYLSRGLTKNRRTSSHYFESFSGKEYCKQGYAWYSFHVKKWQPNPASMLGGDNLLSAVNAFYNALKTD